MNFPHAKRKKETNIQTKSERTMIIHVHVYFILQPWSQPNFISILKVMYIRVDIDKFMSKIFRRPVNFQNTLVENSPRLYDFKTDHA